MTLCRLLTLWRSLLAALLKNRRLDKFLSNRRFFSSAASNERQSVSRRQRVIPHHGPACVTTPIKGNGGAIQAPKGRVKSRAIAHIETRSIRLIPSSYGLPTTLFP